MVNLGTYVCGTMLSVYTRAASDDTLCGLLGQQLGLAGEIIMFELI